MLDFPNLEECTHFPLPEGTNLEFKISFNSLMTDKIYATICGILNSGGGYLVIGVEDETRYIVGIKTNKSMDYLLLALDCIYHHGQIKLENGSSLPLDAIKSSIVKAAGGKEVLVITCVSQMGEKYTIKDGTIYYRLAASNYKQTTLPSSYSQKDLDAIIKDKLAKQAHIMRQQFELESRQSNQIFQYERNKLILKFKSLEEDFERVVKTTKQTEKEFNEFRNMLFTNIQLQKAEVEQQLRNETNTSWFTYLFGCCL
jgi:hypothetical protein